MRLLKEQAKRMLRERRLLDEHALAESNFTVQRWCKTDLGELCVHFQLGLALCTFDGVLIYPDLFPDVPAYILPQKLGERWSGHQYKGSGVLCLQYGPDNWHSSITGLDLVRSANVLLWNEMLTALKPDMEGVQSRHSSTFGGTLRGFVRRFVVTAGLRSALIAHAPTAPLTLVVAGTLNSGSSVAVVTGFGAPVNPILDVPQSFALERSIWPGRATSVETVDGFDDDIEYLTLMTRLGAQWPWTEPLTGDLQFLVMHDARGGIRAFLLWGGDDPCTIPYHTVDFSSEQERRLPSSFAALATVKVGIVGLGSVGSKIAVSLARAGVRDFLLADDDVLAPENLVRNELNWLDVGSAKVDAVERELKRISVGMEIATNRINVAGQENPLLAAKLTNDLANCSVVIDATANPEAFVVLAALCKRSKIAMVWGEVLAGGAGAMMSRSRPTLDADALSIRAHVNGVLSTMAPVPEGRVIDYGLEAGEKVYIASDADVSSLAASMTQFALDTLCSSQESAYPVAAYVIGYREYWEFRGPFDTFPIDCSAARLPEQEAEHLTDEETAELAELNKAMEGDVVADNGPK
jgi:hypothetical protein